MTIHADWVSASASRFEFVAPGGFQDAFNSRNDEPALLLSYDEVVVLTGSIDELRARLEQGLEELGAPAAEAMKKHAADQQFRATLSEVYEKLTSVEGLHEDADEALNLVHGLITRLWDPDGMPIDGDEPRELESRVPYAESMADTAAGPGSN